MVESWPSPGPCWLCRGQQFELISLLFASAAFGFVADLCFMLFNLQHLLHLGSHGLSCCIARGGSKSHLVAAPGLYLLGHPLARTTPPEEKLCYETVAQKLFILFLVYFCNYVYLGFSFCVCFPVALAATYLFLFFFFHFILIKYYLFNMIVLNVFLFIFFVFFLNILSYSLVMPRKLINEYN